MLYYIHQTPLSFWSVEGGGLGTRLVTLLKYGICGAIVSTTLLQHQEVSSLAGWLLHGGSASAGSWEGQARGLHLLLRCEHAPYCQRGGP